MYELIRSGLRACTTMKKDGMKEWCPKRSVMVVEESRVYMNRVYMKKGSLGVQRMGLEALYYPSLNFTPS